MRAPLTLLALILAWVALPAGQIRFGPQPTATTGLLGAYAMSTTADASGNNRTATFANLTTVQGRYNQGQAFNGTTSRMTLPAAVTVTTAFTVEAWVNLTGLTRSVVGRAVTPGPREVAFWQALIYKSVDVVFLAEAGGFFTAGFTSTTGTHVQLTSPTPTTAGVFHHVAASYDGATVLLYVDGAIAASRAATGTVATSTQPFEVGSSMVDGGYFAGTVDDVRIYSRALSPEEIKVDLATPVDTMREEVVSWDMTVYGSGPEAVAQANVLRTAALCNQAPAPPPTGTVRNPTTARVTDPAAADKECELTIASFILGLPVGTGYTSTAAARGATTVSAPSPRSNVFDRVAVAIPPPAPSGPPVISR